MSSIRSAQPSPHTETFRTGDLSGSSFDRSVQPSKHGAPEICGVELKRLADGTVAEVIQQGNQQLRFVGETALIVESLQGELLFAREDCKAASLQPSRGLEGSEPQIGVLDTSGRIALIMPSSGESCVLGHVPGAHALAFHFFFNELMVIDRDGFVLSTFTPDRSTDVFTSSGESCLPSDMHRLRWVELKNSYWPEARVPISDIPRTGCLIRPESTSLGAHDDVSASYAPLEGLSNAPIPSISSIEDSGWRRIPQRIDTSELPFTGGGITCGLTRSGELLVSIGDEVFVGTGYLALAVNQSNRCSGLVALKDDETVHFFDPKAERLISIDTVPGATRVYLSTTGHDVFVANDSGQVLKSYLIQENLDHSSEQLVRSSEGHNGAERPSISLVSISELRLSSERSVRNVSLMPDAVKHTDPHLPESIKVLTIRPLLSNVGLSEELLTTHRDFLAKMNPSQRRRLGTIAREVKERNEALFDALGVPRPEFLTTPFILTNLEGATGQVALLAEEPEQTRLEHGSFYVALDPAKIPSRPSADEEISFSWPHFAHVLSHEVFHSLSVPRRRVDFKEQRAEEICGFAYGSFREGKGFRVGVALEEGSTELMTMLSIRLNKYPVGVAFEDTIGIGQNVLTYHAECYKLLHMSSRIAPGGRKDFYAALLNAKTLQDDSASWSELWMARMTHLTAAFTELTDRRFNLDPRSLAASFEDLSLSAFTGWLDDQQRPRPLFGLFSANKAL